MFKKLNSFYSFSLGLKRINWYLLIKKLNQLDMFKYLITFAKRVCIIWDWAKLNNTVQCTLYVYRFSCLYCAVQLPAASLPSAEVLLNFLLFYTIWNRCCRTPYTQTFMLNRLRLLRISKFIWFGLVLGSKSHQPYSFLNWLRSL